MTLAPRESMLLLATLTLALFAGTATVVRPKYREWREVRERQEDVRLRIEQDRRLVEQRSHWAEQLGEVSAALPVYPMDRRMDVHWLTVLDRLASRRGLKLLRHEAGEERRIGEIYELPIECREWEGSLEAVVLFLFDLQNERAMLDVRQMVIRPKSQSLLRGQFTLFCAYARGREEET